MFKFLSQNKKKKNSVKTSNIFKNFKKVDKPLDSEPIFATGIGRGGTHFLAELFSLHNNVDAFHLDDVENPTADSFLMYAKYNKLILDFEPFFKSRDFLIVHNSYEALDLLVNSGLKYLAIGNYVGTKI